LKKGIKWVGRNGGQENSPGRHKGREEGRNEEKKKGV
jgi:hypothetical protein